MQGNFIKVHVTYAGREPAGEWLWARPVGPKAAKVCNIPFGTRAFTLGDLVEIDEQNEIVRVLERGARTRHASYPREGSEEQVRERFATLRDRLGRFGIVVEGIDFGLVALAVPGEISDPGLATICRQLEEFPVSLLDE